MNPGKPITNEMRARALEALLLRPDLRHLRLTPGMRAHAIEMARGEKK